MQLLTLYENYKIWALELAQLGKVIYTLFIYEIINYQGMIGSKENRRPWHKHQQQSSATPRS